MKLRAETVAILRSHRPGQPLFSNMIAGELFDAEHSRGRFKVLPTVDRKAYVAFDTAAPLGEGALGRGTLAEALRLLEEASREADARGESNSKGAHGWRLNWDDPRTWEPASVKLAKVLDDARLLEGAEVLAEGLQWHQTEQDRPRQGKAGA